MLISLGTVHPDRISVRQPAVMGCGIFLTIPSRFSVFQRFPQILPKDAPPGPGTESGSVSAFAPGVPAGLSGIFVEPDCRTRRTGIGQAEEHSQIVYAPSQERRIIQMSAYSVETEALYQGEQIQGMELHPESIPCFFTTAFTMRGFQEVQQTYASKGYTYIRTRNPNRTALGEIVSCLEGGEETLIFASGMGAITSTLMALLEKGDHVICNANIYGETFGVMTEILGKCGVEVSFVDFQNLDDVVRAVRPETKLIYSEVFSNPTLVLADLKSLGEIAHQRGALLMVDNTFTSPVAIQPISFGADIVVNSLTKFLNGHSDAMGGAVTARKTLCAKIQSTAMLLGTPGEPFSAWLIQRGIQTAALRLPRQMHTAERLAKALAESPHVKKVYHPSLPGYPQRELADSMFGPNGYCAMLSFVVEEDLEKIDQFMLALRFPRYAPTLGGLHTTLSHPVTSSHMGVPDETRRKMGITPGMIRVSVGIEDPEDLTADFLQALEVFGA